MFILVYLTCMMYWEYSPAFFFSFMFFSQETNFWKRTPLFVVHFLFIIFFSANINLTLLFS